MKLDFKAGHRFPDTQVTFVRWDAPYITPSTGHKAKRMIAQCDCGTVFSALASSFTRKSKRQSCGCLQMAAVSTHGLSKHPLYRVLQDMHRRCYDKTVQSYRWYGGLGIKVCNEWSWPEGIENFIAWNNSLPKSRQWEQGLEIDRKNTLGNYEPNNCHWVSSKQNCRNTKANIYTEESLLIEKIH